LLLPSFERALVDAFPLPGRAAPCERRSNISRFPQAYAKDAPLPKRANLSALYNRAGKNQVEAIRTAFFIVSDGATRVEKRKMNGA
jgi:hypothetical protein